MAVLGYVVSQIRTAFWTAFYYAARPLVFRKLGKGCRFEGWIEMPQRGGAIEVGDHVRVCRLNQWTVLKGAFLKLDDGVFLGPSVILSVHRGLYVGKDSMIGERAAVHDNNHVIEGPGPIQSHGFTEHVLSIWEDCWIGAHAILVMGSGLGNHCVVGAAAVLTKVLPDHSLAAGVPAKVIRTLEANSYFSK